MCFDGPILADGVGRGERTDAAASEEDESTHWEKARGGRWMGMKSGGAGRRGAAAAP